MEDAKAVLYLCRQHLRLLNLLAVTAFLPTTACGSKEARLYGSTDEALALVASLGAGWAHPTRTEELSLSTSPNTVRYHFEDGGFVNLQADQEGRIHALYLASPARQREAGDNAVYCPSLPSAKDVARLLLSSTEPDKAQDVREQNVITGAARIGWTPIMMIGAAVSGRTEFTFSYFNEQCRIEVRRHIESR